MRSLQQLKDRFERSWPTASLRTYLIALILLATVPIGGFMSFQIYREGRSKQAQIEDELARSAAALSQAVERELVSSFDALTVLSQSDLVQQAQVARSTQLLHRRPRRDWHSVFVLSPGGSVLLDTAALVNSPTEPSQSLRELHQGVLEKVQPTVSSVSDGQTPGQRMIAVALPVVQDGTLRYILGARISQTVWHQLAGTASVPAAARASLFDAQDRLIGYSPGPAPAGMVLPRDAAAARSDQPSGVHRSSDIDSRTVYAAWHAVPMAAWQVRVALPAAPIDAAHRMAIIAALSNSGASLLLGLLLAAMAARRVARPLHQLATQGPAGVSGRVPVREVALLRNRAQDAAARFSLEGKAHEFETLFDSSPMGMAFAQDPGCRVLTELAQEAGHVGFFHYRFSTDSLTWTPGQCKLFGIDALPAGGLCQWYDRIATADRDRVERELWTACALRREKETLEYCVPQPGAGSRWLSSRIMLHYDNDGRAAQMIGATADMTDQKQSERERAQLTERALTLSREAEAASRAKDEFLTMLSHELRNPLGAISAATDVLDAVEAGSANAVEARAIIGRQIRKLAHMMNNLLDVGSSEGSRFTVRLPAGAAPSLQDSDRLPLSRRRKVLVVEDNDDVLSALRFKLELDGHSVSTAVDGNEGLTRLLKLRPEVSIVDIGLPGLAGFELARHARAAGYAGRMIALSGHGAECDAQAALVAGFDAYLIKPVDRNQLRASLSAD